jgi:hypothetical protein
MTTYTPKYHLSPWSEVEKAIEKSKSGEPFLVIVCFVQSWIPPAVHSGEALAMYGESGRLPGGVVFIVDADSEPSICAEKGFVLLLLGVIRCLTSVGTPAFPLALQRYLFFVAMPCVCAELDFERILCVRENNLAICLFCSFLSLTSDDFVFPFL